MNKRALATASFFLTPLLILLTACSTASKEWNDAQRLNELNALKETETRESTSMNHVAQTIQEDRTEVEERSPEEADKSTQLRSASANGDLSTVKTLLEEGTPVDGTTENGTTPLMWAAMNGHNEVVEYLIGQGAHVDQQTKQGVSALMLAAEKGHMNTVELLLKNNADPHLQAITGDTAMDLASRNRRREILHMLLDHTIQRSQDEHASSQKEIPSTKMLVQGIEQVTRETLKDLTTDKELDVNIVGMSRFDRAAGHHLLFARVAILEDNQRKDLGFIRHFRLRPMEESNWKLEMITTQTGGIATESTQTP